MKFKHFSLLALSMGIVFPSLPYASSFLNKDSTVNNSNVSSNESPDIGDANQSSANEWGPDDYKVNSKKIAGVPNRINGTIENYHPVEHYNDITAQNFLSIVEDRYEINPLNDFTSQATDLTSFVNDSIFTGTNNSLEMNYQFRIDDASLPYYHTGVNREDTDDYFRIAVYGQAAIEINLKVPEYRDFGLELYRDKQHYYFGKTQPFELIDSCDCKVLDERIRLENCPAGDYLIRVYRESNLTEPLQNDTSCYSLLINVDYENDGSIDLKQLENECDSYASLYVSDFTPFYGYISNETYKRMPWMSYNGSLLFRHNVYSQYINSYDLNRFTNWVPFDIVRGVGEKVCTAGTYHQASLYITNKIVLAGFYETMLHGRDVLSDTTTTYNEKVVLLKCIYFKNTVMHDARELLSTYSNELTRPYVILSNQERLLTSGYNIAKAMLVSSCTSLDHTGENGYLYSDSEQRSINAMISFISNCLNDCTSLLRFSRNTTLEIQFNYEVSDIQIGVCTYKLNTRTVTHLNTIIEMRQPNNPYLGHVLPLKSDNFEEELLSIYPDTIADYSANDEPEVLELSLNNKSTFKLDSYRTSWYSFTAEETCKYDFTFLTTKGDIGDIRFIDEENIGYRRPQTISTIEPTIDTDITSQRNASWVAVYSTRKTAKILMEEGETIYIKINPLNYNATNQNEYFASDGSISVSKHIASWDIGAEDIRPLQNINDPYSEYEITLEDENDGQVVSIYSDCCKTLNNDEWGSFFVVSGKNKNDCQAYVELSFELPINSIGFDMAIWADNGDGLITQYAVHILGKADGVTVLDEKVYCKDMGRGPDSIDYYEYDFSMPVDTVTIIIEPQIPQDWNYSGFKGRVCFEEFSIKYK